MLEQLEAAFDSNEITIEKVLRDLEMTFTCAMRDGKYHSALRAIDLQGKYLGMFSTKFKQALESGGGLGWLTYEFGVPLAMVFIMFFLLPVYHRAGVISIYELLGKRFNGSTRLFVSFLFQISRGLATGVAVYTVGFVIAIFFGETDPGQVWTYIIAIGVITLIYDALGGIRAVAWTDVLQGGVLMLGFLVLLGAGFATSLFTAWVYWTSDDLN